MKLKRNNEWDLFNESPQGSDGKLPDNVQQDHIPQDLPAGVPGIENVPQGEMDPIDLERCTKLTQMSRELKWGPGGNDQCIKHKENGVTRK